jgi:hypothetical protein
MQVPADTEDIKMEMLLRELKESSGRLLIAQQELATIRSQVLLLMERNADRKTMPSMAHVRREHVRTKAVRAVEKSQGYTRIAL